MYFQEKLLSKLEESELEQPTSQEDECVICIQSRATMKTMPCKLNIKIFERNVTDFIFHCRWTSSSLSSVFCKDDSVCCCSAIIATAMCYLQVFLC